MNTDPFVFTEAFNCGELLVPFLTSYLKYHNTPINIICANNDIPNDDIMKDPRVILIDVSKDKRFADGWGEGHRGTALCFATAIKVWSKSDFVIHFDSDVIFKQNCVDDILAYLTAGSDIVGTPRAYKHNLSGVPGVSHLADTISTYAFGINKTKIPNYDDFDFFMRMCGGWANPLGHKIIDFFDPVIFVMLSNGAKIKFLDTETYGGMNNNGSKINTYSSNLNFDCGAKLVHFGGVGSGCSVYHKRSNPPKSYADWAVGRWKLYAKIFLNIEIDFDIITKYSEKSDHGGNRWCAGSHDAKILERTIEDLNANSKQ